MRIRVEAEGPVGAPPARVYPLLADYRRHHPNFLPPAFSGLDIEQGGVGAGTVYRSTLTLGGRAHRLRMRVDEPEPGRVLTETDLDRGGVTTFTVSSEGDGSRVRFTTEWDAPGIRGWIERLVVPGPLRRLYLDELRRLDEYARRQGSRFDR